MTHPILQLLQAAYTAQDAIEHMKDLASIEPAATCIGAYAKTLMEAAPEHQAAIVRIRDDQGRGVPTVSSLQKAYLDAFSSLYTRTHNTNPAAA